jgi:hypothetical protein
MRNLKVKCIKHFQYKKKIIIEKLKCHYFHHFLIIFHFTLKYPSFHMNFWTNHMFKDIHKVAYQYLCPKVQGIIIGFII